MLGAQHFDPVCVEWIALLVILIFRKRSGRKHFVRSSVKQMAFT